MSKFCPYCGVAHNERGRACCPEHARRISNLTSKATGKRRLAKIVARRQARLLKDSRWRDIAMGRNVDEHLAEIFGRGDKRRHHE